MKTDENGYKIYPLLDGSEVLWAEEERVLFHRTSPEAIPLTIDADSVLDDLLEVIEKQDRELIEARRVASVIGDYLRELSYATSNPLVRSQVLNVLREAAGVVRGE